MMIRARVIRRRGLISIVFILLVMLGATSGAGEVWAGDVFQLFDANIRHTSGQFVPLATNWPTAVRALTTDAWTSAARTVSGVAADGVSLVLVRAQLPLNPGAPVTFSLTSELAEADPGSLWAIDDQGVIDISTEGGAIDGPPGPPRTTLTVVQMRGPFVVFLYRAPRNFDSASGSTTELASRTSWLTVQLPGSSVPVTQAITIVRPLVVFVHGTSADNDAWAQFPLWRDSANELNGLQQPPGSFPFSANRISFNWIWNATGGVAENAETVLPQLVRAVRDWAVAMRIAATQADVVTHSFGGFVARQVAQTQPDPSPLTPDGLGNFRAAANWGHGSIHKLIALAATHRGAASANAIAFVNEHGDPPENDPGPGGTARAFACLAGKYIDKGAVRDQMVLSEALKSLGQTRVPGHAVVGSGRALLDPSKSYKKEADVLVGLDTPTNSPPGPYANANNDPHCPYDALANYTFNLDQNVPPFSGSGGTCSVTPDYDLVVSARSSQGLMPPGATTTPADLERSSGLSLIGYLNHSALHDPTYGSDAIVSAVSDRVLFLLRQPTTSAWFSQFPAVASVIPIPLEQQLSQFDPSWLQAGHTCPAPEFQTGCTADFTSIKVIPQELVLEDSRPAPLFVYGLVKNEGWMLVYSPTFTLSDPPEIMRNCPVTLTSSNPAVVDFVRNTVTNAAVPKAVGVGTATIEVTVQGVAGSIPVQGVPGSVLLHVPVTVTGVGH